MPPLASQSVTLASHSGMRVPDGERGWAAALALFGSSAGGSETKFLPVVRRLRPPTSWTEGGRTCNAPSTRTSPCPWG